MGNGQIMARCKDIGLIASFVMAGFSAGLDEIYRQKEGFFDHLNWNGLLTRDKAILIVYFLCDTLINKY